MASTSSYKKATISFTLPISCQICLGKVKQPVICPNQHVFCTPCLDVWLRHNQLCPTCRVPITPESPCKQIRGGPTPPEEKPEKGLGRALRRARVDVIFDEYESEMERLEDEVEWLRFEKEKIEAAAAPSTINKEDLKRSVEAVRSEVNREEIIQRLTVKLDATTSSLKRETAKFKETNTKLRDENVALSIENGRLKQSLAARSPRKYEKYTQAALQRKVDDCTKEILQLKKALSRSDDYTEGLENKIRLFQETYRDIDVEECKKNGDDNTVVDVLPWSSNSNSSSRKNVLGDRGDPVDLRFEREATEGLGEVDPEDLDDTPSYSLTDSGQDDTSRNGDYGRLQHSTSRDRMGGGGPSKVLTHSQRLVGGVARMGEETLRDGASPAKRRLVMGGEGDGYGYNRKSLEQQSHSSKHIDNTLSIDQSSRADLSKWTGNSSTLEAPSSLAMSTPSTSMHRLQLQERPGVQEAMPLGKQSGWQRPFSWSESGGQPSNGAGNPPRHRKSTSPRRVPRSLIFSDEEEEENSPNNGAEEEVVKTCQSNITGSGQMDRLGGSERDGGGCRRIDGSVTEQAEKVQIGQKEALERGHLRFSSGQLGGLGRFHADSAAKSHGDAPQATGSGRDDGHLSDWGMDASNRNSLRMTEENALVERGQLESCDRGAAGHSRDGTLDGTLSNLDFSLTPEFVDCTKLFREAENRLSCRQSAEKQETLVVKGSQKV